MSEFLRAENIGFSYSHTGEACATLDGVSFSMGRGEFAAIQGRSGSGKSTLFYVLGCLLKPNQGKVWVDGVELTALSSDEQAAFRNRKIGFVFQQFHLLPRATVLDNILLPTLYSGDLGFDANARATELAKRLGLGERLSHMPNQLSGGEQQRVAIARALMTDADLILADEPTGNLDSANALVIIELLKSLAAEGKTVLLITHDPEVARYCPRILRMQDGKLLEPGENSPEKVASQSWKPAGVSYRQLVRTVMPLALSNLARNKVRAFLTMVGVTIGICALFAMITFGEFAKREVLKGYEELGVNTVRIRGYNNSRRKASDRVNVIFQHFDYEKDLKALPKLFKDVRLISPLLMAWHDTANFGGLSITDEVNIFGVGAEYNGISPRPLSAGRPFTPYHVESRSSVCIIGADVATRLFRHTSPLEKILFISSKDGGAYPCQVIGVMAPQTSNQDWRKPNLEVILPFTYFASVNGWWESQIHSFVAQMHTGSDVEKVSKAIKAYFQQKYGPSGEFNVDANSLLVGQLRKFLTLFTLLLSAIALITLSVGGVGINNMMLVAIAERFKEIGLRKAMGATNRSIRLQFLMESTFLSLIAGLIGVVLGFAIYEGIIYLAARFVSTLTFQWVLDPIALGLSLVSIVAVGIFSGIVPALKAERLSVIDALRSE